MLITRHSLLSEFDRFRNSLRYLPSTQELHPLLLRDELKNNYYSLMNNLDQTPHFRLSNDERTNITSLCDQLTTTLLKLAFCGQYDNSMSTTTNLHPENGSQNSSDEEPEEEEEQH